MRLATSVATTVLVTLVAAAVAYAGIRLQYQPSAGVLPVTTSPSPASTPSPNLPAPTPTAQPAGLFVIGDDRVDPSTAWLLLSDCPLRAHPTCHVAVAGSSDGGETWSRPAQVGPAVSITDGGAPQKISF